MRQSIFTLLILTILLCGIPLMSLATTYEHEWENPTVYERGKEQPHAWFTMANRRSLNGQWRFRYDSTIDTAPADFFRTNLDDSSWTYIDVPGNWELQGFGTPVFINIKYMWTPQPPYIDIPNPVGTYRTCFNVPDEWMGQHIVLGFGSITGYARVCVNGREVGMTKASKTPAEFDVTDYVVRGKNHLAVQVYRWHDGSYMEDQDMWRLTGIERDVYLQVYRPFSIWDFAVEATPVDGYRNGRLRADVLLRNFGHQLAKNRLVFRLVSMSDGQSVFSETRSVASDGRDVRLSFAAKVRNVRLWSAEHPDLYELQLIMDGDTVRHPVGFREVKIEDARLKVNGHVVYIRGVNRHEHDDTLGHVPTHEKMLADLRLMKQLNINAIRTSHYPNDPYFLELCDRYGFYVIDEANIETHGMGSVPYFSDTIPHPAYRPGWVACHEDRIHRMFYRDRNHPSIIGWSLGNECGNGQVFHDQYRWLKAKDRTRFVQFEQAWEDWNTDVVCPMYPSFGRMKAYAQSGKQRPYIMCEYAHAQGNSLGNLQELWDVIKAAPNMQGGFVWDWQDQGFRRQIDENDDHRTYWMYNGGMGSYVWPDDENSGADGLVSAWGEPKPQAYELKKVYQPIVFTCFDWQTHRLTIHNEHNFTPLSAFRFQWVLSCEGQTVGEGNFSSQLAAEDSTTVHLPLPVLDGEREYTLQVYALTAKASPLVPANYEVAREQFLLAGSVSAVQLSETQGSVIADDRSVTFVTPAANYVVDRRSGLLTGILVDGRNLLVGRSALTPYFWRAPNDNDFGNQMPQRMGLWRQVHANMRMEKCTLDEKNSQVCFDLRLADIDQPYTLIYTLLPDGGLRVEAKMDTRGRKRLPELPRFGMRMTLIEGTDSLTYYGRGPLENYPDRNRSQFIGCYESDVAHQAYPYIRPQQTGCHTDTRWLRLTNARCGATLVVYQASPQAPFSFSALHYADEDLDPGLTRKMQHQRDLLPRRTTHLIIDNVQRGLGGDNSWGEQPHAEYRHWDADYHLAFVLNVKK